MKLTAAEIQDGMNGFTGTFDYYRHITRSLVYTDGVQWLAENAECYWLIDLIASWQPKCRKDEMLASIQFWTLKVNEDKTAVAICERDTGNKAFQQKIPYTDFPLKEIKLYCAAGGPGGAMVLMLTSEY